MPAPAAKTKRPAESKASDAKSVADSNIRVDVSLLDTLMNLVGELVLARNQVLQFSATQEDATFLATTQRLNLITTELQEGVMKTRMQPIGNVWSKFPRVVRDLSVTCGKQVRIVMEGEETELDKTIIEAIKDPLTHVVRNSVDHGIESPEDRVAKGKPAEGCLLLRAFHEGGQVNIEISDDGGGIDPERVKAKAIERGVVTQEQASRMDERELVSLVFRPGFSTAAAVTHISGRGVGMDVVKTNIEKIGGTVDIHSRHGHGTTLKVKIPLTLAIIPALIVSAGQERFAIPQVSLLELVRLEGEQMRTSIERIHGTPVYRLRGNLLPLVYLDKALELAVEAGEVPPEEESLNIVVLQADDRHFGLVVGGINDTEEIVVKPLSKALKGISAFAGATIMGDGRVALILDVLGLAQRARLVSSRSKENALHMDTSATEQGDEKKALLIVGIGDRGRMGIPLSSVARLEEIPASTIEFAGDDEVVQYRGEIMPLLRLSRLLGRRGGEAPELMQVVVYSHGERSIGMVVDQILDVVHDSYVAKRTARRTGIQGSAVIQGRVTDLLDLESLVRSFDPSFFEQPTPVGAGA